MYSILARTSYLPIFAASSICAVLFLERAACQSVMRAMMILEVREADGLLQ